MARRGVPLGKDPESSVKSLAELVGIANAIETEAQQRYLWLAAEMARRGATETAEAFRKLAREEDGHISAVKLWAEGLGEAVPQGAFSWRLPEEFAGSWDTAAASTLLTPYRAFAVAVDNEQRAYAFYIYLAARADDPKVAAEAEALAREELKHAALLRVWRRAAWRREKRQAPSPRPEDRDALLAMIAEEERAIAALHRRLAERLTKLGDRTSAALLAELARQAEVRAAPGTAAAAAAEGDGTHSARSLLFDAQKPLERLSEKLEDVLIAPPDEGTQRAAQDALADVVARIARLGRRIESLQSDGDSTDPS